MSRKPLGPPPLSRPFLVDEWHEDETFVAVVADEQERGALAALLGLPAVAALGAEFTLTRRGGGRIEVHGRMSATVTQICVVSLDPFEAEISEPVDVAYASKTAIEKAVAEERRASIPGAEPPDPIIDGRIDLGALAAEFLALGLDPYPRKSGADFAAPAEASAQANSPFAVLGRLKGQGRPPDQ